MGHAQDKKMDGIRGIPDSENKSEVSNLLKRLLLRTQCYFFQEISVQIHQPHLSEMKLVDFAAG